MTRDHATVPAQDGGAREESLRERLRRETRELHDRAEEQMRLVATPDTVNGYARLLLSMRALHLEHGGAADRAGSRIGLTNTTGARLDSLASDLAQLDADLAPERMSPPSSASTMSFPAEELGVLYVLEGSALGAKVLLGLVERALPVDAPTSYLTAVVEESSKRWPQLIAALAGARLDHDLVVRGARRVFEGMLEPSRADRTTGGEGPNGEAR